MDTFDLDLSKLSPDDRRRVCRWVEDRIINAITPFDVHLQREAPVVIESDPTLQAGQHAVKQLMVAVDEVRRLAGVQVTSRLERSKKSS